jgi:hypothetical protein
MSIEFQQLMMDNIALRRWEDEEGNPNCTVCKCPLVMHMFGLHCGETQHGCQNPKCKKRSK